MIEFEVQGEIQDKKQNTDKWLEDRSGHCTGSKIKDLMNCGKSTSKMTWNDIEKVFDFGDTAMKYAYKVCQERKTKILEHQASSFSMSHGNENEVLVKSELRKHSIVEDVEFIKYHSCDFLGASPDGIYLPKDGCKYNLEIKSPTSWEGVRQRTEEPFDHKHIDFWQINTEMLVQGMEKTYYVVTLPMKFDKYETLVLEASEIHQKRIVQRARIVEKCYGIWVKGEHNFRESLALAIAEFKLEIM